MAHPVPALTECVFVFFNCLQKMIPMAAAAKRNLYNRNTDGELFPTGIFITGKEIPRYAVPGIKRMKYS